MSTAPQRVVGLLMSDIAGSTRLYDRLGDVPARRIVANQLRAMEHAVMRAGGRVVKSLGDGLLAVFAEARAALQAAAEIRDTAATPVSTAIHCGPVVEAPDGDVFGDAVNVVARLCAAARADEVLASEALRDALMPEDAERLQPIPPLYVKGKRAPVRAFAWLHDADRGTLTAPTSQLGSVGAAHQSRSRLLLSCNGVTVEVREEQDATLGRDPSNDLPIPSTRASRHHARIYFQGGHFFVEDQSSNGTWIEAEDLPPFRIHRDRAPLLGRGRILCGADPAKAVVPEVTFARD